nr:MAG TPA: hypothetical protein [Caudoviricetes sp.]
MRRRNLRLIQVWCGVRAGRGLAGGSAYSRARGRCCGGIDSGGAALGSYAHRRRKMLQKKIRCL